jgi:hypothetical protein
MVAASRAGRRYRGLLTSGRPLYASDPDQAREWLERAQASHSAAMNNLGVLIRASDPDQARSWWQRAAQVGDTEAMKIWGCCPKAAISASMSSRSISLRGTGRVGWVTLGVFAGG